MSVQPESKLQRKIRAALEAEYPTSFFYKVHGGPFTRAGLPDLAGVVRGHSVFLEIKRPGECASRVQLRIQERLRRAGAIVGTVTSIDEALAFVREGIHGKVEKEQAGQDNSGGEW